MRIPRHRRLLTAAAIGGTLMVVTGGSAMLWTKVYCVTCQALPGTTCRFNGQDGTWGPQETLNGTTFNVCIASKTIEISPDDAYTEEEARAYADRLRAGNDRSRQ